MESADILRIAIWDDQRLRPLGRALDPTRCRVSFADRATAEQDLSAGRVDLALLPPDRVLADMDNLDVLPAVAYASWSTPHASLALRDGFEGRPSWLAVPHETAIEQLVARVVLKEHYGMEVQSRKLEGPAALSQERAILILDEPLPSAEAGLVLDLGQEWYELTNYPMVWGLFATRKGEGDSAMVALLRDAAALVETADDLDGTDPGADGMGLPRFRFDDVAQASLTEFCTFAYFYGAVSELQLLAPVEFPDAEDVGQDGREPLL